MENSRRDLFNDMAEHRPTLKNNQNYHPRFGFAPKTGVAFPKIVFTDVTLRKINTEICAHKIDFGKVCLIIHRRLFVSLCFREISIHVVLLYFSI